MDIKSEKERSRNMAKIKSTRTKPEMYIRTLLFHSGLRYRVNYAACYGKPDLFFNKYKVAVFVNGCFWHRHKGCKYAYTPKSNVEFWLRKLEGNQKHDEDVLKKLREQHIRVLVIWECTVRKMVKDQTYQTECLNEIINYIKFSQKDMMEF
jgi:DNA mismatch endonuclease (patch repair protein)